MPKSQPKKTLAELIEGIDNQTTLHDILTGYSWYKFEKQRLRDKDERHRANVKKAKEDALKLQAAINATESES